MPQDSFALGLATEAGSDLCGTDTVEVNATFSLPSMVISILLPSKDPTAIAPGIVDKV